MSLCKALRHVTLIACCTRCCTESTGTPCCHSTSFNTCSAEAVLPFSAWQSLLLNLRDLSQHGGARSLRVSTSRLAALSLRQVQFCSWQAPSMAVLPCLFFSASTLHVGSCARAWGTRLLKRLAARSCNTVSTAEMAKKSEISRVTS